MTTSDCTARPNIFLELREKLFSGELTPLVSADTDASDGEIFGVVMEVGLAGGAALVFGLRDGSASLYLSNGGGALGGQGQPHINAAAKRLVEVAKGLQASLSPTSEHPLPPEGQVRFSILTRTGIRAAQTAERDLLAGNSQLAPLFVAANEILTGFRLLEQRGQPNEPLYMNCLLTALARGHASAVVLTAGEPPPDPATLTTDEQDRAWFAAIGFSPENQSTEKIIGLILKAAGFGMLSFGKKEGRIRTSLVSHDGKTSSEFDFRVTKQKVDGRLQARIAPLRG